MGVLLFFAGIVVTILIAKLGHHDPITSPEVVRGRPGLVTFLGAVGPCMVIVGIIMLIFG